MPQPLMPKKLKLNVLWWPTRPYKSNTKKRCPFRHRGIECKSRTSKDNWSNRQIWPSTTKRNRGKASRVLPRECTGHSKHPLPTAQEKTLHMDITRCSIPKSDWWYSLQPNIEKLYTISKSKTSSWLAQIMNSLLLWTYLSWTSDVNWRKQEKPLDHSGMT